jgi:hypothetical protein
MVKDREFMILGRKSPARAWLRWGIPGVRGEEAAWSARMASEYLGPDSEVVVLKGYVEGRDADTGHEGPLPTGTEAKVVMRRLGHEIVSGQDLWRLGTTGKLVRAYESAAYKADTGSGPRWRYELLTMPDGTYALFDGLSGERVSMILHEEPSEAEVVQFGNSEYARMPRPEDIRIR